MSQSPSFPSLDQVYPRARSYYALKRSIRRLPSPSLSEVSHRSRSPLSIMSKSREAKSKTSSQQRKQIKYNRRNVFSIDDVNLLFEMSKSKNRGSESETSMRHEQQTNHMNLDLSCDDIKKTTRDQGTFYYSLEEHATNLSTSPEHMSTGPSTSTWRYEAANTSWDMTWMSDSHETLNLGFYWSFDGTEETTVVERDEELNNLVDSIIN